MRRLECRRYGHNSQWAKGQWRHNQNPPRWPRKENIGLIDFIATGECTGDKATPFFSVHLSLRPISDKRPGEPLMVSRFCWPLENVRFKFDWKEPQKSIGTSYPNAHFNYRPRRLINNDSIRLQFRGRSPQTQGTIRPNFEQIRCVAIKCCRGNQRFLPIQKSGISKSHVISSRIFRNY